MSTGERKNVQLVKVYVRQRPFTQDEIQLKRINVVKSSTSTELVVKSGAIEKKYTFDHVFAPACTQAEVYGAVVAPLINLVLSGYTCTTFAYGQTGTGKTHTMIGPNVAPNMEFSNDPSVGIVPRAAIHIFDQLSKMKATHSVKVSFVEIYNEEVRDLLVSECVPLRVYDDPDNKGATCIKGLTDTYVKTTAEVTDLLNVGTAERQTASTKLNRHSSRSHTIFTIVVNTREITAQGEEVTITGKLNLIDLAGSENIGRSGATEMRAREAGSINKSLLTLGKVITALSLKSQHVPYRESKLTRILQDSLGGKSQTCMVATFAPCKDCFDETLSTLDYANVARTIANNPTMNVNRSQTQAFKVSQDEVARLRQELNAARAGKGFYMHADSYQKLNTDIEAKSHRINNLMQQIKELDEHIDAKRVEYERLEESFQETTSTAESIARKIEEQSKIIRQNKYVAETMDRQFLQLRATAIALLDVAETSTQLEGIYHNKYGTQCVKTINNASIDLQMSNSSIACLKEMIAASAKSKNNVKMNADQCRGNLEKLLQHGKAHVQSIATMSQEIQTNTESLNLSFDSLFEDGSFTKSKFQSQFVALGLDCNQMVINHARDARDTLKELCMFTTEKRAQVEALTSECNNTIQEQFTKDEENQSIQTNLLRTVMEGIKNMQIQREKRLYHVRRINQMREQILIEMDARHEILLEEAKNHANIKETLNELLTRSKKDASTPLLNVKATVIKFNEEIKPLLEDVSSFVTSKVVNMCEKKKKCLSEIDAFQDKSIELYRDFTAAYEAGLHRQHQARGSCLGNFADEAAQLHQNMLGDAKHVDRVNAQIAAMAVADKTLEDDMAQFLQQSSQELRRLHRKINTQVHVGDTPAKPVHQYPQAVDAGLSVEALRALFEISDSDEEDGDNEESD